MKHEMRVAAITGAAQGIGRKVAEVLSERGYRLALNDLRMPDKTLRSIQSRGGEAIGHAGNIADESIVEGFVRSVYDIWGRTDVLVNNAGISLVEAGRLRRLPKRLMRECIGVSIWESRISLGQYVYEGAFEEYRTRNPSGIQ